jgi:hypothetical protein
MSVALALGLLLGPAAVASSFVGLRSLTPLGEASAANSTLPLTGSISGPGYIGTALRATYTVTADGGPAVAANGTQTGIFSFKTSLSGANTTGALVTPVSGVLVNRTTTVSLTAPNVTESLTLAVLVTSSNSATKLPNATKNLTDTISVVRPYHLSATLVVTGSAGVNPFSVTVELDGAVVGAVSVPALTAGATYPLGFDYVNPGLSPGEHTFSINLAPEHGLVVFAGGQQVFTDTFYVEAPPVDYTIWIVAGVLAFVGAIFIWLMAVGARRRGRRR